MERIVVLSDQQARFDDRLTEQSVLSFLRDFQPDLLINNGDLFDLEALSHYRKSLDAQASLEADLAAGRAILAHQRAACPDADIVLVEGNHEERLTRFLLDNARELSDSPMLHPAAFLDTQRFGVRYVGPYGVGLDWHGVLVYHGALVRAESGASARAEYLSTGTSGVSGHTHRLGSYYHTDRSGAHAWYEGGCLCNIEGPDVPPDARGPRVRNAQQVFLAGYYDSGLWNLYQVSITRHCFIWEGKLYVPDGAARDDALDAARFLGSLA